MNFKAIQNSFFFGGLFLVTIIFLALVFAFLTPIFWALVLAVIFHPLYEKILRKVKENSTFAAFLTIFVILIIVILPLYVIGGLVLEEAVTLYQEVNSSGSFNNGGNGLLDRAVSLTGPLQDWGLEEASIRNTFIEWGRGIGEWLLSQLVGFGEGTFRFVFQFFLTLYILLFLLRDGVHLKERLVDILPLGDRKERKLFANFAGTVRAVMKGTLLVGIVQGTLGGLLFWFVGIGAPALWGAFMTVLSIIPAVGPAVVWVPAGVILLLTGEVVRGFVVIGVGVLLISVVDNILRPILIERDTQMPDALILVSTLGGLSLFGVAGFVIGPVMAALFLSMWQMFEEEYKDELVSRG